MDKPKGYDASDVQLDELHIALNAENEYLTRIHRENEQRKREKEALIYALQSVDDGSSNQPRVSDTPKKQTGKPDLNKQVTLSPQERRKRRKRLTRKR